MNTKFWLKQISDLLNVFLSIFPWKSTLFKNLQTINAGEGVEKREPSCTVGGKVNWYSHSGEVYGVS